MLIVLDTRNNSSKLSFQIVVAPWNDCEILISHNKSLCKKQEIKKNYERPSTVVVRNIKVYRILTNELFIRKTNQSATPSPTSGPVEYTQSAPLMYEGTFTIDSPAYLVFSQTFDKDWKLTLFNDSQQISYNHLIANMYANAWYVEKEGFYTFKLEYSPQKYFYIGIVIAIFSVSILIAISILGLFRKKLIKR